MLKKTAAAIAIGVIFLGSITFIDCTEAQTIVTQPDTSMNKALADSLLKLSSEIKSYRPSVIGEQIQVTAGQNSGTVIGESIVVTPGQGGSGNVVGKKVEVTIGPSDPKEVQTAQNLEQAASHVLSGKVDKSWIKSLLDTSGQLASASITAVSRGVASALLDKIP